MSRGNGFTVEATFSVKYEMNGVAVDFAIVNVVARPGSGIAKGGNVEGGLGVMGVKDAIRVKATASQIHGEGSEGSFFRDSIRLFIWMLVIIKNHKASFPIRDLCRLNCTFIINIPKEFVNNRGRPVSF